MESWTIKQQIFDAFELRWWRRFLKVPWTARGTNESILKENNPEYPWKDLYWSWSSNILAIWCKSITHWKRLWCGERLRARKETGERLSSFTFIKRLFSSSPFAIKVVLSGYLRLLIFLLAISISACTSSSLAFCMVYTSYKLNNQGDSIQPWRAPFPIWNQSVVPCPVLTALLDLQTDFSGGW